MRILIVTNLYPPHYYGGYEVRCAQVAEALRSSGHDVRVLTSAYGVPLNPLGKIRRRRKELNGVPVHRVLNQYAYEPQPAHRPWTLFQAKRELSDVKEFVELVKSFQPHVIHRFVNAERRGSELYTYDLCRSLAGRHDVAVLHTSPENAAGRMESEQVDGLPTFVVGNAESWEEAKLWGQSRPGSTRSRSRRLI
jgi:hypothetical protein